jgi:putative membrane protein
MKTMMLLAAALLFTAAARADEAKLNDPQIANVALTAHNIDIARGRFALQRTKDDRVKLFAQQMVDDHEAGAKEAVALAERLGVKPEESAASKGLLAGAHEAEQRLRKDRGAMFDKHYIETEIAYHQAVIDAVKNALIPGAQNAKLRTLLEQAVPTLEGHLQHAKHVLARLTGGKAKG